VMLLWDRLLTGLLLGHDIPLISIRHRTNANIVTWHYYSTIID
jgi:hypothetical protein